MPPRIAATLVRYAVLLWSGTIGCAAFPCTPTDAVYAAHVADCDARIGATCARDASGRAVKDCPVLVECEAWARGVCK